MKTTIERKNNIETWEKINSKNVQIAYFEFYFDKMGVWLNQALVDEKYRNKRVGLKIMKMAKKRYQTILISKAHKTLHFENQEITSHDTRYINSADGELFVNGLLKHNVISNSDIKNPFGNNKLENHFLVLKLT